MTQLSLFGGRRLPVVAAILTGAFVVVVWYKVPFPTSYDSSPEWKKSGPVSSKMLTSGPCYNSNPRTEKENHEILKCVANFKTFRENNRLIDRPQMEVVRVNSHSYLNSESQVLEVGGYTGEDAAKLIKKYNPHYFAMEPIPRYQKILQDRYKQNPKFKLLKFGLGKENKTLTLNIDSDATSLFRAKKKSAATSQETAEIREINNFFQSLDVERKPIDLISINCEGCEYELLELLISSKIVNYLKNIQFQFHLDLPGIANQECRYCSIMTLLSRTHTPTFQYSYTWQSWKLRA